VTKPPLSGKGSGDSRRRLVAVGSFVYRHEAQLAQARLEAEDIEAFIVGDDAGGMGPGIGLSTGGIRVCVAPEDAHRAAELLKAADSD
jgi:hypothetical protein